jgi:hypothetical protein
MALVHIFALSLKNLVCSINIALFEANGEVFFLRLIDFSLL